MSFNEPISLGKPVQLCPNPNCSDGVMGYFRYKGETLYLCNIEAAHRGAVPESHMREARKQIQDYPKSIRIVSGIITALIVIFVMAVIIRGLLALIGV